MKLSITEKLFNFKYNGKIISEKELITKGINPLTGIELKKRIENKIVFGDYLWGYKFISDIYNNGFTEGINQAGTHDSGQWEIKDNIMLTNWNGGWQNTKTKAYTINNEIHFYNVYSGEWQTSFRKFIDFEK